MTYFPLGEQAMDPQTSKIPLWRLALCSTSLSIPDSNSHVTGSKENLLPIKRVTNGLHVAIMARGLPISIAVLASQIQIASSLDTEVVCYLSAANLTSWVYPTSSSIAKCNTSLSTPGSNNLAIVSVLSINRVRDSEFNNCSVGYRWRSSHTNLIPRMRYYRE